MSSNTIPISLSNNSLFTKLRIGVLESNEIGLRFWEGEEKEELGGEGGIRGEWLVGVKTPERDKNP